MGFQNSDCDRHLDYNRPDIVVMEKEGRVCYIIVDVACPFDTRVAEKEREKISGLKKGKCKRSGTAEVYLLCLLYLRMWISKLGTPGVIALLQKACLQPRSQVLLFVENSSTRDKQGPLKPNAIGDSFEE